MLFKRKKSKPRYWLWNALQKFGRSSIKPKRNYGLCFIKSLPKKTIFTQIGLARNLKNSVKWPRTILPAKSFGNYQNFQKNNMSDFFRWNRPEEKVEGSLPQEVIEKHSCLICNKHLSPIKCPFCSERLYCCLKDVAEVKQMLFNCENCKEPMKLSVDANSILTIKRAR